MMISMSSKNHQLGKFLRKHRNNLKPDQAGVENYGSRRVPGLRREELASLAGVSVNYYTKLEQGEYASPSTSVLSSLARALQLNHDEKIYLYHIAGYRQDKELVAPDYESATDNRSVTFQFENIVYEVPHIAAMSFNVINDVISYNQRAWELFYSHIDPEEKINTHQLLFMDQKTREIFVDWKEEAELAVASLRFHVSTFPENPTIQSFIKSLREESKEFSELWDQQPVQRCTKGKKRIKRSDNKIINMDYQVLHSPHEDGKRIIMYKESE